MRATIILVLAVVLGASGSARAADAPEQILVLPDAIAWKPGPPSIFQVDGIGPVSVTYVDPADDPRKK